ncbi:MAG: prolipoprotein diacylglyceryl transferase [Dehalococcoidia bacterium]|jgi:phosphatidylglycerol:prolipoprotein diacylglycerol transferase
MGVAFSIGSLDIRWYGIMLVIAILSALFISRIEAKRRGENPDHLFTGMLLVVPLGFIGARAYHVIDQWSYYSQYPGEIIGGAGLGIFGAVIGGAIGGIIYTKWRKLNTLRWFDICAPGLILAQAIGRWGNYFNQEVYGKPTDLPWAIFINPENRIAGYSSYEQYHPLFFYESMLNLIGCIMLLIIGRKFKDRLLDGEIFIIYVIYYSTIRFSLEWLRIEPWTIAGLPTACWVSLIAIIVSIAIIIYRRQRRGRITGDTSSHNESDKLSTPPEETKEAER